jgi:hypothetical protein
MRIESGGGTVTLTVKRGQVDTVASAHELNAAVYSGYEYAGLVVDPVDDVGSDESVWYKLALNQENLDSAQQGAPLNLGAKQFDEKISFWRRCTVLPGTPVQNKTDIRLRLTGTQIPIL